MGVEFIQNLVDAPGQAMQKTEICVLIMWSNNGKFFKFSNVKPDAKYLFAFDDKIFQEILN